MSRAGRSSSTWATLGPRIPPRGPRRIGSARRRGAPSLLALLLAAVICGVASVSSASASESLWNMEGLGRPLGGYDLAARGAGGTAIAIGDPYGMSFVNPASIARAELPQGQFGIINQDRWIQADGGGGTSRRFDTRLTGARVVIPGPGILRWGLGYRDLTDGSYRVRFRVNEGRADEYVRSLTGRGGVGELSAALAARLVKDRAAVGLHFGLANGTLRDLAEDAFTGGGYLNTSSSLRTRVENGLVLGAGLRVQLRPDLALGGCVRRAAQVDLKAIWRLSGGAQWQETASFELPASSGLGVAWSVRPRVRVAADWNHTAWASARFRLRTSGVLKRIGAVGEGFGALREADRVGLGLTLLPAISEGKAPLLRRTVWRAGFTWEELPVTQRAELPGVSGITVSEWALTAGAGLPVQIDRGFLDLLLEIGRTGNLEEVGARETFVRVGAGVSFGRFADKF